MQIASQRNNGNYHINCEKDKLKTMDLLIRKLFSSDPSPNDEIIIIY